MLPDLRYYNLLMSVSVWSVQQHLLLCLCRTVVHQFINTCNMHRHMNPFTCGDACLHHHCRVAFGIVTVCLQAFVEQLHGNKQYWVPIVDPGIKVDPGYPAYDQGLAAKAFITDFSGQPYLGQVGPLPLPSLPLLPPPAYPLGLKRIAAASGTTLSAPE